MLRMKSQFLPFFPLIREKDYDGLFCLFLSKDERVENGPVIHSESTAIWPLGGFGAPCTVTVSPVPWLLFQRCFFCCCCFGHARRHRGL